MSLLVLVSTCGFELFAVSAAHLARSEATARQHLLLANAELRATYALLAESTRMAERLKISRSATPIASMRRRSGALGAPTWLSVSESASRLWEELAVEQGILAAAQRGDERKSRSAESCR
jgi:hypothetical protein